MSLDPHALASKGFSIKVTRGLGGLLLLPEVCISTVISEKVSEMFALPEWEQMMFLHLEKENTLNEFQVMGRFLGGEERGTER